MKNKHKINPIRLNDDNLRRWCLIYLPKYLKKPFKVFKQYELNDIFNNFDISKAITDAAKFFNVEDAPNFSLKIMYYQRILTYMYNLSNLSPLQKQSYWRYYMSSNERIIFIKSELEKCWNKNTLMFNVDKWTETLKKYYEKI